MTAAGRPEKVERGSDERCVQRPNVSGGTSVEPPGGALCVYVVHPPELAGQVIELTAGLTIGREASMPPGDASSAPFALLSHPTVSRRHCFVREAFGVPVLEDLGSSNGTRVDGAIVTTPSVLLSQCIVRIGSVLCVVDERPVPGPGAAWTPALPGIAPAIVRARDALRQASSGMAPVLILGETGTGKERIAAELAEQSGRPGPYVKFSCAALSRELAHSQLFGHERGAFTGASASHRGLFGAADGGTLFLDEVGELDLELQAKLLRALQEGEIRPLGSTSTTRVDVRVIAATNRELSHDVESGRFRRDPTGSIKYVRFFLAALQQLAVRVRFVRQSELQHRSVLDQCHSHPVAAQAAYAEADLAAARPMIG